MTGSAKTRLTEIRIQVLFFLQRNPVRDSGKPQMWRREAQRPRTNKDQVFLPLTVREKEDLEGIFRWIAKNSIESRGLDGDSCSDCHQISFLSESDLKDRRSDVCKSAMAVIATASIKAKQSGT